jgi:hypothetical protein
MPTSQFQFLFQKKAPEGIVDPSQSTFATGSTGPLSMIFDANLQEAPTYSATPTKNLVESGATITDHVTDEPDQLVLHCIISDTPVSLDRSFINTGNIFSSPDVSPVEDALLYLQFLKSQRLPFDVITNLQTYTTMVITNLAINRDPSTGSVLDFTVSLQEILIAQTSVIEIPENQVSDPDTAPSASSPEDGGKQATTTPTDTQAAKGSSILDNIFFGGK